MNERERSELEFLKRRHETLSHELLALAKELESLEKRLGQGTPESSTPATSALTPDAVPLSTCLEAPGPSTSPLPSPTPAPLPKPAPAGQVSPATETRVPPVISPGKVPTPITQPKQPEWTKVESRILATSSPPSSVSPFAPAPAGPALAPPAPKTKERSFEMRMGTFWLPLIGIVLLVTGLVFFGNYAYQNFIVRLNAVGKVSLLYAASFTLLGLGWWWQRKHVKESLRNYGQVLFSGGLATVYFTTYAAHHFPHLKVIPSAALDGALLLGWAGYMVWVADRRKSQALALFSVLLAYYSAIITHVGNFTLYSNLVLTLAAVFFLVRNRWATLSFVSMAASYAAYGYWRFCNGAEWHWASVEEGLWSGTYFLIAYWIVFTAAVFLSRDEKFAGANRSSFLTLNNGAFFTMFLLTMYQVHHGGFWKFSLVYGIALIGLAELSRRFIPSEPLSSNSFLTQGLSLGTIGLISNPHLAGLNLALVLAAESVTLLLAGHQRKSLVMLVGAYGSAALAVGWGMDGMLQNETHSLWLGVGLGAVMLGNTWLVDREHRSTTRNLLRPQVSYFVVLALAIWWVATYNNTVRAELRPQLPLFLAVEGLAFVFSVYLLQIREFGVFGQAYLGLAQAIWIYDALRGTHQIPWWNTALMFAIAIGIPQWWGRQKALETELPGDVVGSELKQATVLMKYLVLLAGTYLAINSTGGLTERYLPGFTWDQGWFPMGLGTLILVDVLLANGRPPLVRNRGLRFHPSFSMILVLIIWLAVTWHHTSRQMFPLVLIAEGLLLTFSIYLLQVPEISVLGQGYVLLAQVAWLYLINEPQSVPPPWWNPLLLTAITLSLGHWWQKQKTLVFELEVGRLCEGLYAAAIIGVLYFWLKLEVSAPHWLALTSLLAIGITAYGVFTRAWPLAILGQFFICVSAVQFVVQMGTTKPDWFVPLFLIFALGFLSWSTWNWFQRKPDPGGKVSGPLLQVAQVYRWVALAMSLWWAGKYIPDQEQIWFLTLLGLATFGMAGWRQSREALLFGAAYTISAVALFWQPDRGIDRVYLPNLLALLTILSQQQIAHRLPNRYRVDSRIQGATIIVGGLSMWLLLSDWVVRLTTETSYRGSYLTASYSVLALVFFAAGIALHERVYRWLGLGILGFCLGRVMIIDVWKLENLYRVLSCMALGIVILVLGFIYNKYQDKLKHWL